MEIFTILIKLINLKLPKVYTPYPNEATKKGAEAPLKL